MIAVALYTSFGSGYAVAVYVAVSALITILAVGTYSETRQRDLSDDPAFDRASVTAPVIAPAREPIGGDPQGVREHS